jgi:hypothetical protein
MRSSIRLLFDPVVGLALIADEGEVEMSVIFPTDQGWAKAAAVACNIVILAPKPPISPGSFAVSEQSSEVLKADRPQSRIQETTLYRMAMVPDSIARLHGH